MVEQFVNMKMKDVILNTWKNKLSYPLNHKDIEELEGIIDYYEGENQELKKQLSNSHQIKTQQKEFIEWLENKLVSELDVFTEIKVCAVLSKYKEIMGDEE